MACASIRAKKCESINAGRPRCPPTRWPYSRAKQVHSTGASATSDLRDELADLQLRAQRERADAVDAGGDQPGRCLAVISARSPAATTDVPSTFECRRQAVVERED